MRQKWENGAGGKPRHLPAYCLGDFHMLPTPNTQKTYSLAQSIVRTSPNLALMPVTATYGDFAAGDTSVGLGP